MLEPALSRRKTDAARTCNKRTEVPRDAFAAGLHAQSACAGQGQDRTYFPTYFHAMQEVQSLVVWTLVKADFFFKSLNNTSFLQQPIHSS